MAAPKCHSSLFVQQSKERVTQSLPRSVTLVAEIIDALNPPSPGPGHPPAPSVSVVETLRFFLREGVQWRALHATDERACGSTLRRRLKDWSATGVLRAVQARLITMIRCGPQPLAEADDVIVDSCSVRAKRGGELIGPNPTDRGKPGSKYHVVVAPDGIPLGAVVSALMSTTPCCCLICCDWLWWSAPPSLACSPMLVTTAPPIAPSACATVSRH